MKVFRRSTINMAPPPEEKIIPPSTEVLLPAPEVNEMSRNNIKTELSRATTDFVIRLVKKYVEVTPGPVESDVDTAQVEPLVSSAFTSIVDWFEDRVEPTHEEHQFLHDLVLLKEAHDDMQRLAMATLSAQRAMQIISHNPNNPTANNLLKEFSDLTQTSSISDTTRQTIAREVILKPILNSVHSNNSEAVKKQYQFLDALNRQIDPLADVLDPEALCAKVTEQVVVSYLAAQDVNTQNDDLFNLDAVLCTAITKAHQGINSAKNAKILNHNPQNTIQITQIIFLCDYWLKQANRTYTKIVANEKDAEQDTVKSYILADIGRRLKEATDTHDTDSQSNIFSELEAAIVEYIVNDLTFKLPQFNMANIVDNIKMAATLSENIPTADARDIHSNTEDQPEDAQVQPEFKPVIATHRSLGTRALLATGTAAAITLGVAAPAAATGNDAAPVESSPNSNTLYVDKVPGGPSDINLDNGTVTMSVMSAETTAKELIKTLDIPVVEGDIYRSGLDSEGPFIVEQFAIHILKRLAQKYNMPESNFVTEEHVVALVAFAKGEGGDINNKSIFNLFNLGAQFSDSEQSVYGGDGGDGRQAYTGFDMGVEVNARQMAMGNQSRLGHILSDPNSTADDFMYALTHYELYEGNNFWAEASLGPVGGDRLGPEKYYQTRMNLVENVEDNYGDIAGLQIGTAEKEQQTGKKAINLIQFTDLLDTPPTETPDTDAPTDSPSTPDNGEGEPDGGGNSDSDATPKNEDKPDKGPQVVIIDDTPTADDSQEEPKTPGGSNDAPTDSPSTPDNGEGEPDGGGNSDSDATPKNEDKPDKGPQVVIIDDTGAVVGSDPSPSPSESPIIESTAPPSSEQVIVEPDTIAPTPSASLQPTVVDAYQRIDTGEPVIEVTGTKGSEFSSTPAPEAAKHIAQTAINYLVGDDEFQKIHGLIGEVPNPQMDYELHTLRDTLESRLQILANQPNFDQIKSEVYRRLDMAYDIAKNPSLLNESAVNDALKTPQWLIPEKVKYIQLYNIGAKRSGINIPDSGEHAYDKKTKVLTLALANSALVAANTPESLAAQFKAEKEPAPAEQAPTITPPETSSGPVTKEVIAAELKIPAQSVRKSGTMAIISSDKEVLDILGLKPNGGYPFPKGSHDGDEYHLYKQNCTSYTAQRQEALGKAVPDHLGNAGEWRAKIQKFIDKGESYTISTTPTVGAIVQWNVGGDHHKKFGHVAVIEAITAKGILISEYNVIKTKSFGLRFLTNEYLQNDTQSGKMVYITLPSA